MTIAFPKPDEGVLARRDELLAGLAQLVAPEALVTSEDERRAFETDALTAYRKMPLAVVLPSTTEEVSAVLKFCHEHGVKVVPRGAGTSLCGGAIPQEDAIILGVAKMNRVLETDFENRTARVQAGVTNLAISQAVAPEGFFYAPDPSSQLACTIAGNIAMNSGGAHCLKYGVTTNNLLGVTHGAARRHRGRDRRQASGQRRLRPPWPHLRLGGPAWRRDRGDRAHPARRRGRAARR